MKLQDFCSFDKLMQSFRDEVISNYPIIDSLGRTQQALFVNDDVYLVDTIEILV